MTQRGEKWILGDKKKMALTVEEEERARGRKADSQNIPGGGGDSNLIHASFFGLCASFLRVAVPPLNIYQ